MPPVLLCYWEARRQLFKISFEKVVVTFRNLKLILIRSKRQRSRNYKILFLHGHCLRCIKLIWTSKSCTQSTSVIYDSRVVLTVTLLICDSVVIIYDHRGSIKLAPVSMFCCNSHITTKRQSLTALWICLSLLSCDSRFES